MEFTIDRDGRPRRVAIVRSHPEQVFDRAGLEALKGWRYQAGPENPTATPALLSVKLDFTLAGGSGEPMPLPAQCG